jgi:hypothetical protein
MALLLSWQPWLSAVSGSRSFTSFVVGVAALLLLFAVAATHWQLFLVFKKIKPVLLRFGFPFVSFSAAAVAALVYLP